MSDFEEYWAKFHRASESESVQKYSGGNLKKQRAFYLGANWAFGYLNQKTEARGYKKAIEMLMAIAEESEPKLHLHPAMASIVAEWLEANNPYKGDITPKEGEEKV